MLTKVTAYLFKPISKTFYFSGKYRDIDIGVD